MEQGAYYTLMGACAHACNIQVLKFLSLVFRSCSVTGDANFSIENTCLTVGQPGVARALIEQCAGAEVGFSQRFLWMFPQPSYSRFSTLEAVNKTFTDSLGIRTTTF